MRLPLPLALLVFVATAAAAPPGAEEFTFNIEWHLIDAGTAVLRADGHDVLVTLTTNGLAEKLHRVRGRYEAAYQSGYCVQSTFLNTEERNGHTETRATFPAERGAAHWVEHDLKENKQESKEVEVAACVHDVIGALLKLRELNPGSAHLPISDGKRALNATIEQQRQETVATPLGKFAATRYEAHLLNGNFYRRKGHLYIWLTNDAHRLPVRIQFDLPFYIGDVTLNLINARSPTLQAHSETMRVP
jgi:hypothetical protein